MGATIITSEDLMEFKVELLEDIKELLQNHNGPTPKASNSVDNIFFLLLCIISRVFSILMPDDVEKIIEFLSPRTHFLVLCDDIFNLNGEQSMVRMPYNFFLVHNFRDKLEHNGFTIEEVIMANVPHREFTGIIIAKGQQN